MQFSLSGLALWALATSNTASAHYRFSKLVHNGRLTNDWEHIRENSNGIMPTKQFLTPSDDFRCNSGSFANAGKTKVASVMPGDKLGFQLWCYATMQHPGPPDHPHIQSHRRRAPIPWRRRLVQGASDGQPVNSNPPAATNPSNGGTVPLWGQCGETGWTGPTACSEGACKFSNDWYSQCQK
ncbi:hypothetical protein B0T16DRAFT_394349 [Cercophora newfieldiana]|uniref:CBM1 domain-containing protein n=1 Tax=Cercophora newfieldiana TaxID=92897 RepID=A0AA39XY19_9PEZI|nr:hypothetical protein B0T16DRAFT_394349 [Cercophora newfieldiana]